MEVNSGVNEVGLATIRVIRTAASRGRCERREMRLEEVTAVLSIEAETESCNGGLARVIPPQEHREGNSIGGLGRAIVRA